MLCELREQAAVRQVTLVERMRSRRLALDLMPAVNTLQTDSQDKQRGGELVPGPPLKAPARP
jgi:hypothetical protein